MCVCVCEEVRPPYWLTLLKMYPASQVQILDKTLCVFFRPNTLLSRLGVSCKVDRDF